MDRAPGHASVDGDKGKAHVGEEVGSGTGGASGIGALRGHGGTGPWRCLGTVLYHEPSPDLWYQLKS